MHQLWGSTTRARRIKCSRGLVGAVHTPRGTPGLFQTILPRKSCAQFFPFLPPGVRSLWAALGPIEWVFYITAHLEESVHTYVGRAQRACLFGSNFGSHRRSPAFGWNRGARLPWGLHVLREQIRLSGPRVCVSYELSTSTKSSLAVRTEP